MRGPLDQPLMVVLLGAGAIAMAVPAGHAVVLGDYETGRAFLYAALLVLVFTALVAVALSGFRPANVARSHLVQLAGAFVLVPLALALPLTQAVPGLGLRAAWFEMVASFTTTGATILPPGVAPSVHLWRAEVGWMGGFFTLLAALAILAPMNLGGFEVITGESAGRGVGGPVRGRRSGSTPQITRIADPSQRLRRYAGQMLPVYAGLTLVLWIALILAGDPALVGLCHAMSTLSTSGISPLADPSTAPSGRVGEAFIAVLLLLALTRQAFPGASHRTSGPPILQDPELRMAAAIIAGVAVGLTGLELWQALLPTTASQALRDLWGNLFTALSFLTTTGFAGRDWLANPAVHDTGLILATLALLGGGVATTAGGLKLMRTYTLYRHGAQELERLVHPHAVGLYGAPEHKDRNQGAYVAWVFAMLLLISVAVVMLALTMIGNEFEQALILSIAALTNTGPLADLAGSGPHGFATQTGTGQVVLAAAMVLGRLETLALIAILAPNSWRG